jgi:hypothetical protein
MNGGTTCGRIRTPLPSPNCPGRLWGQPTASSMGTGDSFPWGKSAGIKKLAADVHLLPRLRMSGDIPHVSHILLHGMDVAHCPIDVTQSRCGCSLQHSEWNIIRFFINLGFACCTVLVDCIFCNARYTGCFTMFSVITNIYSKKTKGSTLMKLFTATGKLNKFFFDNESSSMCAPRVTRHTSIRYSSSCHSRVNVGASIFFTAAMIRALRSLRKRGNCGTY